MRREEETSRKFKIGLTLKEKPRKMQNPVQNTVF